ncbi:MAG: tyrosine-type recombinase/integrase [Gemmatimonadota bacterium]
MPRRKRWKYSAGRKPHTITVYERRAGANLFIKIWEPTAVNGKGGMKRRSLGHRDRERAIEYADEQARRLRDGSAEILSGKVTLERLFRLYLTHQTPTKKAKQQLADQRRAELWLAWLGRNKDPHKISPREWREFMAARLEGRLGPRGHVREQDEGRPVNARTVEQDAKFLRAVVRWGTQEMDSEGRYLLRDNVLRGFEVPKNPNPNRPIATADQLEALLRVADDVMMEVAPAHPLHPEYGTRTAQPKRPATVRGHFGEILELVNATGRRIGAVRSLAFSDLRLDVEPWGAIRWPSATDKMGIETVVPINADARAVLDRVMASRPGAGSAPLFPAPGDPTKPIDAFFASKLMRRGIALARKKATEEGRTFDPPRGFGYHSFRRKWATEVKDLSPTDAAALGGWKNAVTMQAVYQQPDWEGMLQVIEKRRTLRENHA